MRTRPLVAGALVLAGAMFLLGALVPMRAERSQARTETPPVDALAALSPLGADPASIEALLARIDVEPDDAKVHAQLALAYLQKARNEATPSQLPPAEEALRRSLELEPRDNLEAFVGSASLANARHDFSGSLRWSRRAIETSPHNAAGYGLLGDALFELGRVRAADAAYQKMVEVRPDVASYVRASYALQYHRRIPAAIDAMRLALQAAGPSGETAAWVRHQMGDIYASLRKNGEAARQNQIGIEIAPGFVPPTVGLAESHMASGRLYEATEIMEKAVRTLPSLEYMITLGDLYVATGRDHEAAKQYRLVASKLQEYRRSGVLPDADLIVFYADHGLRPRPARREAVDVYRNRPTTKTADALAWILHAGGRNQRAWRLARDVISAPSADSSMLFHAGMIASSLGNDDTASRLMRRALDLDPTFSVVQAPIARRIVQDR